MKNWSRSTCVRSCKNSCPNDAACRSALDTPIGHLLGDYMMALERRLPAVTEADFPGLTLCRNVRIQLYRLFEDTGAVARHIRASGFSKRMRSCATPRPQSRYPRLPRTSASHMPRVSAALSNESSGTTQRSAVSRAGWAGAIRDATRPRTIGTGGLRRPPSRNLVT